MKRHVMPLLLVFVAGGACAPAPDAPPEEMALISPYLEVQAALAGDTLEGVPQSAGAVAAEADKLGADGAAIATGARAVAGADDIAEARTAFGELSDALLAYATAEGLEPDGIRIAYCPMVNKSWYQEGDAIRNPFYGSEMLECGAFRK